MAGPILKTTVIVLAALVLQVSLLTQVRFVGVSVDLMLILAVAAGLAAGPDRGAVIGFFSGLLVDLLVQTPFGLSALTYALIGYLVGSASTMASATARWFPYAVGFLAGLAGMVIFVLLGELVGEPMLETPHLLEIAVVVSVSTALLTPPMSRLMAWAIRPSESVRAVT